MHLLTTRRIVLFVAVYAPLSLLLIVTLILGILTGSTLDTVVCAIALVFCVFQWKAFVKAYKMRMHDRSYADAKAVLWHTLDAMLPVGGDATIECQSTRIYAQRNRKFLLGDVFRLTVIDEADHFFDAASSMHKLIIPVHLYGLISRELHVKKWSDCDVLKVVQNQESDELELEYYSDSSTSIRDILRAMLQTPSDLLIASVADIQGINALLVEGRKE